MHLMYKYLPEILRAHGFLTWNIGIFIVMLGLFFLAIVPKLGFLQELVGAENIDIM